MTDRAGTNDPRAVFWRFMPWAIAALFALLAAWFWQQSFVAQTEAEVLRHQQELAELALKSAQQQLEAERILNSRQIASLVEQTKTPTAGGNWQIALLTDPRNGASGTSAAAVWDPAEQQGVLVIENPSRLAAGQALELWLIGANGKPVSAGILDLPAAKNGRISFKPAAATGALTAIAISRERADGAKAHAQPAEEILRGTLR